MGITRKTVTGAATLALAAGLGVPAPAASAGVHPATAASSSPARHTVVLEPGAHGGGIYWMVLEPRFQICFGPSAWVQGTYWPAWNNSKAVGRGTEYGSDFTTWRAGRVTVVLTRPVNGVTINGHEHPYFTRLHVIGGKGIAHYWHWSWPEGEWSSAPL
jgi:hypothetical protein